MGRQGIYTKLWWGNLLKNCHFEDQEGDGRIKFGWILFLSLYHISKNMKIETQNY
jgi:hypothetical protein